MKGRDPSSPFLRACRRLAAPYTPVWLMRQAGRYMPEYQAIRARHSMLDMIRRPEVAAEVTMQPVRAFGVDAAIVFSDILPPLAGMGLDLEYIEGTGPRIGNPVATPGDVDALATPPSEESMGGTLAAIEIVTRELSSQDVPLIGFAGAPFTLASYAIEGGGAKHYKRVKSFMYREPDAWRRLMNKLVDVQADYLLAQARAGASALQVFDSWVGLALGADDYARYVQPYNATLFERLSRSGVPTIHFSTGTGAYLDLVAACGGDVVSVDWRVPLDAARARIGDDRAIQGNLDPVALLGPWPELRRRIDEVLDRSGGRAGHVFNLGHGIFPETPVDNVRRLVEYVHQRTAA